jgi:hypothetical protein
MYLIFEQGLTNPILNLNLTNHTYKVAGHRVKGQGLWPACVFPTWIISCTENPKIGSSLNTVEKGWGVTKLKERT